jgi:hypothetical protein
MTIPMNTRNPRTPGLISKGYAGLLLPHTATFDEKLVTGTSNAPGTYATVYATARTPAELATRGGNQRSAAAFAARCASARLGATSLRPRNISSK